MEVVSMRALDKEVVDAVFETIVGLLPERIDTHPLGTHRPRVSDRLCFRGILIRLVTGCSWETAEAILDHQVSDTTLRFRRDEWVEAGVFNRLRDEAVDAYDRIIGLDLSEVALDGSIHKAPCGGEGTGKSPVDRAKLGWKWSIAADMSGIPVGWAIAGANRNDTLLLAPTLADVARAGLLSDVETLHLDRGYDYPKIRRQLAELGLDDVVIQRRNQTKVEGKKPPLTLGLRWIVEATNSWLSNYGQLRRNTDRRVRHRHAQLCLVATILITARLIDYRDRWSPESVPIR